MTTEKYSEQVALRLEKIRFRKRMFLGVDEDDVWKKIDIICKMYEDIIEHQQLKYNAIIDEYRRIVEKNEDDSS